MKLMLESQEKNLKLMEANMYNSLKASIDTRLGVHDNEIFDLKRSIDDLKRENETLKKRAETAETKINVLEKKLDDVENERDELETYVRRPCLIFNGLPVEESKSDEQVFLDLCQSKFSDPNVTSDHISKIHRVQRHPHSTVDSNKPLPLIVKFSKDKFRDTMFRNKKKLKGTGKTISELLTNKRSKLLKKCIERIPGSFSERSIWTDYGKILVKLESHPRATQICSEEDLNEFVTKYFPTK